jgi:phage replication initiation protein
MCSTGYPSVDDAVQFYLTDQFTAGGNKPSCSQQGNWIEADGSGRTFYVGKRKNGKLLRVYEKGKQLGDNTSPWVRWELELHNRDRIIPWDVILEPGKYLAASYACMG